ncbi:MAG: 3-dehydroquinate synthase [Bacteroidales bacterium]
MTARYLRRTIASTRLPCEWLCGRGAIRDFFAGGSPSGEAEGYQLAGLAHGPLVIVTDTNVDRFHGRALPRDMARIVVPAGESSKSVASLAEVLGRMLDAGLDRGGTVVAFGGGVVGDLAGFAAATFMRGVQWVNVPTTLLAMVDASIGGKTGVDVNGAKNLAGAFHPPVAIVADPAVLATLPPAERASGMAETIKAAVIGNSSLFERLEAGIFDDAKDIAVAAGVKIEIVERDPLERGERAVLNLGHTVGHGLESASRFGLTHGQAVSVGIVAEARIAEEIGLAARGLGARIGAALARFGLPVTASVEAPAVRAAMAGDKKRASGRLKFALPRDIGDVVHGVEVEERVVMDALGQVCRP